MTDIQRTNNLAAERYLLGACLHHDAVIDKAKNLIDADDFYGPHHGDIWQAVLATYQANETVDLLSIHRRLNGLVDVDYLHSLWNEPFAVTQATRYALDIADAALRKKLILASQQIAELANDSLDAGEAAATARSLLSGLDLPMGEHPPDEDVLSFIATTDTRYDWLIPAFLERRDRMLITGREGAGKSTLCAQLAVCAASGLHPWTMDYTPSRNVLVVDLENSRRLISRRYEGIIRKANLDLSNGKLRVLNRSDGINLLARADRRWLTERCHANAAELLVIGPVYRMTAGVPSRGDIGGEDQAREATRALDEIRHACNVAIIMETHAPHGDDLRPFGSSVWKRWPDFGVGLKPVDPSNKADFKLEHWRDPRDIRQWPATLHKGRGRMPWTPGDVSKWVHNAVPQQTQDSLTF